MLISLVIKVECLLWDIITFDFESSSGESRTGKGACVYVFITNSSLYVRVLVVSFFVRLQLKDLQFPG